MAAAFDHQDVSGRVDCYARWAPEVLLERHVCGDLTATNDVFVGRDVLTAPPGQIGIANQDSESVFRKPGEKSGLKARFSSVSRFQTISL